MALRRCSSCDTNSGELNTMSSSSASSSSSSSSSVSNPISPSSSSCSSSSSWCRYVWGRHGPGVAQKREGPANPDDRAVLVRHGAAGQQRLDGVDDVRRRRRVRLDEVAELVEQLARLGGRLVPEVGVRLPEERVGGAREVVDQVHDLVVVERVEHDVRELALADLGEDGVRLVLVLLLVRVHALVAARPLQHLQRGLVCPKTHIRHQNATLRRIGCAPGPDQRRCLCVDRQDAARDARGLHIR